MPAKPAKPVTIDTAVQESPDLGGRTWASVLEQAVREDIISGRLPAGSKLRLKELAEHYQAGVIPLREALSRLCTTGFVLAIDQKGFRVAELSPEELLDVTRVRQQIECQALRDAIRLADIAWESDVVAAHHRLTRIPMVLRDRGGALNPDWEAAHVAFHDALIWGCHSPWLRRFSAVLRDQTARYRFLSLAVPKAERGRDVAAEHEAIVSAVVARDADRACKLLSDHFQHTTDLVLQYLARQKGGAAPTRKRRAAAEAPV
ncbi:GntR family transcriptional regulator [Cupriavidus pinatubonensis]|uniref:GntR family transcriptional regulator n=1 Tax=Cupriavidus pinatubonensis TaxID=248026 RepID=UPI001CC7A47B|nr:FCD domain-containing protein [Cupriavidus pinatubonensis]